MKRAHVYVSGRVQGVAFRARTEEVASTLGVTGWVRNLRDGRVEIVIEGYDSSVDRMVAWCREGPRTAIVQSIEILEEPYSGEFSGFDIRYF